MLTQRDRLLANLAPNGWKVAQVLTQDLEWWADEIVILESEWSPKGQTVHLTFLVDPQWDDHRAKGQAVWAIAVSRAKPESRLEAETRPLLRLARGWENNLDSFIASINQLR